MGPAPTRVVGIDLRDPPCVCCVRWRPRFYGTESTLRDLSAASPSHTILPSRLLRVQACLAQLPHVTMKSPEKIALGVAANGAILHVLSPADEVYLIGELRWLDPHRVFWFTAHGDRPNDGHLLAFDGAVVLGPNAISFVRDGQAVAHLTSLEMGAVDDVEDYTVAFSLWRQTSPACREIIDEALEFVLANSEANSAGLEADTVLESKSDSPSPEPKMSKAEIAELLAEVQRGVVTVRTAISLMVINGVDRSEAANFVFHALGGRDRVEIGHDGRSRYTGSGKLVSEVENQIAHALGAIVQSA